MIRFCSAAVAAASVMLASAVGAHSAPTDADAVRACLPILTAADFDNIRGGLNRNYCLANDIDLAGIANFRPIGTAEQPFTGRLTGKGFVIRNLKIDTTLAKAGLFGVIAGTGSVSALRLANVDIVARASRASAGAVAGLLTGEGVVQSANVTGSVRCPRRECYVGGLAGEMTEGTVVRLSSSAARVLGGDGAVAGGLVGQTAGRIANSYATGRVSAGHVTSVGGLVGWQANSNSIITRSFATGPVTAREASWVGGLIGFHAGNVRKSYATGRVYAGPPRDTDVSIVGALIGLRGGRLDQSFAVGHVGGAAGSALGGLVGANIQPDLQVKQAFWDIQTTGQATSPKGAGRTTAQLQATLRVGFRTPWGISQQYSYPYLEMSAEGVFASTLASLVVANRVFAFVPLPQLEPTEYTTPPLHADAASLAAAYTMIARSIGDTRNVGELKDVKIDTYFWNDGTQAATWTGPVTGHAALGSFTAIANSSPISDANVIGVLKSRRLALIRGTHSSGITHWMLATLFTTDEAGSPTGLVANDPWTGQQVRIDLATKRVIVPGHFPLSDFTVDGYQPVTLN